MATLQSDTAIKYANDVIGLVNQLKSIRANVAEILKVNTDTPLGNLWDVLHTTDLASDGTLGDSDIANEAAPVSNHPIDPRIYSSLVRACKSGDLTNGLQILVDLNAFCNGAQVDANGARPGQINNVAM